MSHKFTRRAFTTALGAASIEAAESRPNIVLILSDDHSVPHLGVLGDPVIKTPNLDRFSREGMRCDRMFTAAPQCVPSRTAILTGRSPVAARMGRFSSPLPPDVITLPELLRPQGYYTGICRRWFHLDGPGNPGPVTRELFDRHGMRTFDKRVDFLDFSPPKQTVPVVNRFLDKAARGRPFFLWISFNDPHHGWDKNAIPQPHDPKKLVLPPHLPDLAGVREDLGRYYDEIARMDGEFQSVLDILKERGLAQNTLVVFMGDNGHAFPHGKGSLYDPGLNVPLLARWPGKIKANTYSHELISGEDITPTLLDAAAIPAPPSMSGRSFLPLLTGKSDKHRDKIFAARLYHGNSAFTPTTRADTFDLSRCVRTQKYKLIYNCTPQMEYWPVDSGRDPGWQQILAAHKEARLKPEHERAYFTRPRPVVELYDLDKDPGELNNLAGKPGYESLERELKLALQEKMILDYDFLPLPLSE